MDYSEFRHWSPKEIDVTYTNQQQLNYKPHGLYFSIMNEWLDWCDNSGFSPNLYLYQYKIQPESKLSILEITEYNYSDFLTEYQRNRFINWDLVSKKYDGVHINSTVISNAKRNISRSDTFKDLTYDSVIFSSFDIESLIIWSSNVKLIQTAYMSYSDDDSHLTYLEDGAADYE